MRGELHANPHARLAIVICSVIAVLSIVALLLLGPLMRAPAMPPDPVVQGAATAFDVAEPPSSSAQSSSAKQVNNAGEPNGGTQESKEEIAPLSVPGIRPADVGGASGGGSSGNTAPPVVYTPAAP